ncbi:DUF3159 domain-containing protein [Streptomyces sp. CB02959]|uniref:DUF3159 domain-containing protein n=1 Tax=Streptomyces sp. CB02959 TaxID=2020330 RepID=UPI000C27F3E7|nr:DUF3159 domain-containing protein [Streptomyces sp. CB02959]PJN36309.1 hypothetical protein CG747_33540 [Streptomyces sp. CB02959]
MHPGTRHADVAGEAVRRRLRDAVIDVAPVFGFTVGFALTHRVVVALAPAVVAGVGICVYRLVRGERVRRALAVLGLMGVGGVLAACSGQATHFFLPALVVHCVMTVVTPVLLLLGWPPMGLAVGLITGERTRWRRCAVRRRALSRGNLVMLAGHVVMLSVQLPLFFSGQAVALGAVDVFGPIVLALTALLGWRIYRRGVGTHRCEVSALPGPLGIEISHPSHRMERTSQS